METRNIPLCSLHPNTGQIDGVPKNPRFIRDEKFAKLRKSIEDDPEMLELRELGVYESRPGYYVVLLGNMRLRAMKDLGYKEAPCKIIPQGTDAKKLRAYTVKDNVSYGDNDWDIMANEWDASELMEWGMDLPTEWEDGSGIDTEDHQAGEDDFDEENETIVCRCKKGDIWQCGNHRVMCGDSTDADDVKMLMGGGMADICLTDPPYGVAIVNNKKRGGDKPFGSKGKGTVGGNNVVKCNEYVPIIGDETTDTARLFYAAVTKYSKNQILFGGNYFTDFLPPKACWVIWDKENTGNFADVELAWTSFDRGAKLYKWTWNGMVRQGDRNVEGEKRVHPTQKPVGMLCEILKDFSTESSCVLDLFGGSGSTLIACEQLNRKCYMMELDPHYCDVILARWEKLTGRTAEKLTGE